MASCNCILKFCLLYDGERLLPLFLSCYVVGSCACRSWFLINSKLNTGPINFKLMQKVCDVRRNDWNKVSQNITEEFSWKLQWPVYKNNTVPFWSSVRVDLWKIHFFSPNAAKILNKRMIKLTSILDPVILYFHWPGLSGFVGRGLCVYNVFAK